MRLLFKQFALFASLLVFTVPYSAQSTQRGKPSLSITISAPQTVVKASSPVKLRITMTNISNHNVTYYVSSAGRPYDIYVRGTSRKLAPETPAGVRVHPWSPKYKPFSGGGSVFSGSFQIKPGEKTETEVDLTKEYDLNQPGKYTVQVERRDPENPKKRLKSNVITLTVTP